MKMSKIMMLAGLIATLNLGTSSLYGWEREYREYNDDYVPVVTPVARGAEDVVYGAGRVAKGAVVGTGDILTGDPIGGTEEIVTETVGGTADAVEGALAVPGNILFGR